MKCGEQRPSCESCQKRHVSCHYELDPLGTNPTLDAIFMATATQELRVSAPFHGERGGGTRHGNAYVDQDWPATTATRAAPTYLESVDTRYLHITPGAVFLAPGWHYAEATAYCKSFFPLFVPMVVYLFVSICLKSASQLPPSDRARS